jgi:hypothetical protein
MTQMAAARVVRQMACLFRGEVSLARGWGRSNKYRYHESLKAYLAPTGLVSEPRGDLTCRGDLRLEVPKTGLTSAGWLGAGWLAGWLAQPDQ